MQVKPLFLLFISIPLTGGQYIQDVYVEGMLNCFHLGLKTTEKVKPSLHGRCYFFRVFQASEGKREASEERQTWRPTGKAHLG